MPCRCSTGDGRLTRDLNEVLRKRVDTLIGPHPDPQARRCFWYKQIQGIDVFRHEKLTTAAVAPICCTERYDYSSVTQPSEAS